jgi:putative tricarboxylic transport membrane protein
MYGRFIARGAAAIALLVGLVTPLPVAHAFPDQPVTIIVPTQAGGRVDAVARLFAKVIGDEKLLPVPVVIRNMPGGGGAIGTRAIRDANASGHTVGLWNLNILTAKMQKLSPLGPSDFSVLAQTGSAPILLATKTGGRFSTLQEALTFAKENPGKLLDATNIGTLPFFSTLVLAQKAGARIRPVQSGGGAERLKAILGGHADIAVFGTGVYKQHAGSGLKGLAILGSARDPELPDIPTARELGFDVAFDDIDLWLGPPGIAPDRVAVLRRALEGATKSAELRGKIQDVVVVYRDGKALNDDLAQREAALQAVAEAAAQAASEAAPK